MTDDRLTHPRDYAAFNVIWAALLVAVVASTDAEGPPVRELPLFGLASFTLTKSMSKEKIGTWVREPLVDAESGPKGRGLRHVAGSLPHQLSGGEQQRFAIARALVNDPQVVLADEPTGNLDATSGADVLRLLREQADEGRALLMVTHDPAASAIADRVLRLDEGRLNPA